MVGVSHRVTAPRTHVGLDTEDGCGLTGLEVSPLSSRLLCAVSEDDFQPLYYMITLSSLLLTALQQGCFVTVHHCASPHLDVKLCKSKVTLAFITREFSHRPNTLFPVWCRYKNKQKNKKKSLHTFTFSSLR